MFLATAIGATTTDTAPPWLYPAIAAALGAGVGPLLGGNRAGGHGGAEHRCRMLLDGVPESVLLIAPDGTVLEVNRATAQRLGTTTAALRGACIYDYLSPALAATRRQHIEQATRSGQTQIFIDQRQGRTIQSTVTPLADPDGRIVSIAILSQDITDLKRTEDKLNESEARFRELFEKNRAVELLIDPADGSIVDVNDAASHYYGYSRDEMCRKTIFEINRHAPSEIAAEMERAQAERSHPFTFRHGLASGEVRDVEVYSGPIQIGGRHLLCSVVHDVTGRKQAEAALRKSEARYRSLIDSQVDMVVRFNPDGFITFVNETVCKKLNRAPEELRGHLWTCLVHAEDHSEMADCLEAACVYRAYSGIVDARFDGSDGMRWYSWEISAVLNEDGTLQEIQAAGRDMTEIKRQEADLRLARIAAEDANRAKSRFIAAMSHELRTPLNAIMGFSEILKDPDYWTLANENRKEYLEYIHIAGKQLLDLINDILDISKIEAGKMQLDLKPVEVEMVLDAAASLLRESARRNGVTVVTAVPPDIPDLWADLRAVKQILFNLLSNAIKFTPRGGSITLSASRNGAGIDLVVSDTGIGIAEAHMDRILKPFEQVDNRYACSRGGTGLGLSLVQGLVSLHGGVLEIASTVGTGTTITVHLPAATQPAADTAMDAA